MKKLSNEVSKIRKENSNFFVLEKYNNDVRHSMLKSYSIMEAEAKKLNMSVVEYAKAVSQIAK